jgi:short-subunit dehydrogenase involved in D-alanine esterification of teichoic acids
MPQQQQGRQQPSTPPLLTQLLHANAPVMLQVNNAGILIRSTWDQQSYDSTLKTNTVGPITLSQALLPSLAPGALIIMVSSGE